MSAKEPTASVAFSRDVEDRWKIKGRSHIWQQATERLYSEALSGNWLLVSIDGCWKEEALTSLFQSSHPHRVLSQRGPSLKTDGTKIHIYFTGRSSGQ